MIIKAKLGFPTTFYLTSAEINRLKPLLDPLLITLVELYNSDEFYSFTYKEEGFKGKKLFAKDEVLKGGFKLPDSFYGDIYELCDFYGLYFTQQGFSSSIIPTGRVILGDANYFEEPIFVGDLLNGSTVTEIHYVFDTENSVGQGVVVI